MIIEKLTANKIQALFRKYEGLDGSDTEEKRELATERFLYGCRSMRKWKIYFCINPWP